MTFVRAAAIALAVVLCSRPAAAVTHRAVRWLLAGRIVQDILKDPSAARLLDGTSPYIVQRNPRSPIPPAWKAVRVRSFTSYRDIKRAFAKGSLDRGVQAVMYDNESWKFTPRMEQLDPATYDRLAAQLVHGHGLQFIAAPATDLVSVLSPGVRKGRYDRYIELRIAEAAARYADVYDIQAQGSQRNIELFTRFVRQAAAQARAVNPRIVILAGISTNPSGQRADAAEIVNAIAATRDVVDGYWLNVPSPSPQCPHCTEYRPDIALDVLRQAAN